MISLYISDKWIDELLEGNSHIFYNVFSLSQTIFLDLLHELCTTNGIHGSFRMT